MKNSRTEEQKREINNKRKQTMLNKYGVENVSQLKEVKEKKKNTCLKKYGVDHNFKINIVREKIKQKFLEKYGVENPSKNQTIKNKTKSTIILKYGENYNNFVSNKSKQTMLNKYGEEHYTNKNKYKETCLKKYGVENAFQSIDVQNKYKETCLKKYGVDHNFKIKKDNNYSKISQELFWKIYNKLPESLKSKTYFAELNHEFVLNDKYNKKIYFIDFIISNIKFCLEFYGDYWHRNPKLYKRGEDIKIQKQTEEREDNISLYDFFIYRIWESTYKSNKDFWVNDILENINILKGDSI